MRYRRVIWVLALAAAGLIAADSTDSAKVMMEAAHKKEVVDGDLNGAINQYRAIVGKYKSDRAIAATALVHMAECYQKMGDAEAKKIYEQVVRDYGDQKDAAATASAHLGRSGAARESSPSFRHLWTLPPDGWVREYIKVSPDGRYFPYAQNRDLYLHDLINGTDRRLTNMGTATGPGVRTQETDGETAFSPDSKQLAYTWQNEKGFYEIRVVDLQGSGIPQYRRIFGGEDGNWLLPAAWSPDGKSIVAEIMRGDGTTLDLISPLDGSTRPLRKMEWRSREITTAAFTPDGKYIAFDLAAHQQDRQHDIFVIGADGSRETPVVVHPADDRLVGWSPDGKYLLFTSDRTGRKDLWSLPFRDGKAQGEPELTKSGVDLQSSFGITSSGSIYSVVSPQQPTEIKVATVDFAKGSLVSPPSSVVAGNNRAPEWSPDGKYLAYISEPPMIKSPVIGIYAAETGQTRELRPNRVRIQEIHWSPDGRSFIARARDWDLHWGIDRIDALNGAVTRVVDGFGYTAPNWSPDGKSIYCRRTFPDTKEAAIIERDLASGKEREIVRGRPLGRMAVSPDSRFIATVRVNSQKKGSIVVIPVQGGEFRELLSVPWDEIGGFPGWARDSRSIYLRKTSADPKQPRELIQVGIDGTILGKGVPLDPSADWVNVNPDGHRIAFQTDTSNNGSGNRDEVWVLENALRGATARK